MSSWIDIQIEELSITIPKVDFPLKSDVIVGYENPYLKLQFDNETQHYFEEKSLNFELILKKKWARYNYETPIEELTELCIKYKGTMIVKEVGEEDDTEYTIVREGVKKKMKMVEVEEE